MYLNDLLKRLTRKMDIKKRSEMENVSIGAYSYGFPKIGINEHSTLTIGKFCSIADSAIIQVCSGHDYRRISTFPLHLLIGSKTNNFVEQNKVVIENDVWISENAIILANVTIHNGAVVGAGAIVTHDVEPYAIVAGSPARVIKYRFSPERIKELLAMKWWDWPIEKIKNSDLFN